MTAALQFEASTELPRNFSDIAYSGGAVNEWGEQIVIYLYTTTIAPSMPLSLQHDHSCVIGAISAATVINGTSMSPENSSAILMSKQPPSQLRANAGHVIR